MNGASAIDIQELLQEAIVMQTAFATSSSTGGIGGAARTVNCSTTRSERESGHRRDDPGRLARPDVVLHAAGSRRPLAVRGRPGVRRRRGADLGGGDGRQPSHDCVGRRRSSTRTSRGRSRDESAPCAPSRCDRNLFGTSTISTELAPAAAAPARAAARSQISFPVPPQARFDSRPEGSQGRKAVDRESPLPSTGAPPPWVSALAEGLAAFGGSGIAAILLALVLTPPALRRVRDGAVVRRPVSVLAPIDVPI